MENVRQRSQSGPEGSEKDVPNLLSEGRVKAEAHAAIASRIPAVATTETLLGAMLAAYTSKLVSTALDLGCFEQGNLM